MTISVSEYRAREFESNLERLSPAVQRVIRLDLIQAVGNALRYHQRSRQELVEIEEFAIEQDARGEVWGTF